MSKVERTTTENGSTVTTVETGRSSGSSALWLILGAVLAALVLYFLFAGGFEGTSDAGGDTTIVTTDGAADAVEGAAEAVEGAAEAVDEAASGN